MGQQRGEGRSRVVLYTTAASYSEKPILRKLYVRHNISTGSNIRLTFSDTAERGT